MRTALLLAIGSRGDHEPVIALAASLLHAHTFDAVHLFISPDFLHLPIPHPRLHLHHHSFLSMTAFYAAMNPHLTPSALAQDPVAAQRRAIGAIIHDCITPLTSVLHTLSHQIHPSALLATTLGALALKSLTLSFHVPAYLLHMQPNIPNPYFPFYLSSLSNALQAAAEIADAPTKHTFSQSQPDYSSTYDSFFAWFTPCLPLYEPLHTRLSLPPITTQSLHTILLAQDPDISILLSYPTQLISIPPPPSPLLHVIQPLAESYIPPTWDPATHCPKLLKYLSPPLPKPLCLTVGSMNVDPPTLSRISTALLSGLRRSAVPRVLLLRGSGNAHISPSHLSDPSLLSWAAQHVFESSEPAQFAWLFPHCSAVLCHGGAGTVAAALRAGIPAIVAPVMVDQFFWAELVERWGVGTLVKGGLKGCSTEEVEEAVKRAWGEKVMRGARKYGEQQGAKTGGCEAVVELMRKAVDGK